MTLEEAIKLANDYLSKDNSIVVNYREYEDKFIFGYELITGEPIFDNSMIEVNKNTKKVNYYQITSHFDELKKVKSKDVQK